jgi:hypothetical protein
MLSRFLRLPRAERVLVVQTVLLLAAIRAGLRVFAYATVSGLLGRLSCPIAAKPSGDAVTPERTLELVEAVARRVPAIGTCLTQAMAAHVLLARRGYTSDLRIGVRRDERGHFTAHAWLEHRGTIVLGAAGGEGFSPMPALEGLQWRVRS